MKKSKSKKLIDILYPTIIIVFLASWAFMPEGVLTDEYLYLNDFSLYSKISRLMGYLTVAPGMSIFFGIILCAVLRIDFDNDKNMAYRVFISAIIVYVILYFAVAVTLNEYIVSSICMLIGTVLIIFAFWNKLDEEQKSKSY